VVDVTAVRFNVKGGGAYTLNLPEGGDVEGLLAYVANQHVLTLVDQTTGAHGTFWTRDLTSVDVDGEVRLVPRGRTREVPAPTMQRAEANERCEREGRSRGGWSM
jgi:hypothetical protein